MNIKKSFNHKLHRRNKAFTVIETVITMTIFAVFITMGLQLYTLVESQRSAVLRQNAAVDIAETNLKKFYSDVPLTNCSSQIDLTSSLNPESSSDVLNKLGSGVQVVQSITGYPLDGCTGTQFNSTIMRIESVVTYGSRSEKRTTFARIQTTNLYSPISVEYLVIAGGGGGGGVGGGGGGGGGGFRTGTLTEATGTAYTVTVGAGGLGTTSGSARGENGGNSVFDTITANGGGGGGSTTASGVLPCSSGGSGGGGGGGINSYGGGGGCGAFFQQGFGGGGGSGSGGSGGGGGAGGTGTTGSTVGGAGGIGKVSTITGASVYYSGGGGGGQTTTAGTGPSSGGTGGGGNGGRSPVGPTNGTPNTGGGGGGSYRSSGTEPAASGGSGVVILKIPNTFSATFSAGVTSSVSTSVTGYKVYTITATGASPTVTFSKP